MITRTNLNETYRNGVVVHSEEVVVDITAESIEYDLHLRARKALVANANYLAVQSPTAAQVTAQVNRLTRQNSALIRLLIGNDLLEGVPTLTTLLVRRNNRPEDQELMKFLIGPVSSVDLIKVLDLISLNPAINQAKEIAQDWANKARTSIQGITNKETLKVLEQLCDAVILRSA